ncbi:hypothetical protein GCM10028777_13080 [Angustibacter speluncae]
MRQVSLLQAVLASVAAPLCFVVGVSLHVALGSNIWFFAGGVAAVIASSLTASIPGRVLMREDADFTSMYRPLYFRSAARGTRVSWKWAAAPAWFLMGVLALSWIALVMLGLSGLDTDGA